MAGLGDWADAGRDALGRIGEAARGLLAPELRLGVTGLRRSGKTVFVTSVLDNLLKAGRLPFLDAVAEGRYRAAQLRPQPDWAVPRFAYERHLAALTAAEPDWPAATSAVSEIRLAVRFESGSMIRRNLPAAPTLTLDIVDYPGEWLIDLGLLDQDFETWSRTTLDLAAREPRRSLAAEWVAALAGTDPAAPFSEGEGRRLGDLYASYLRACRDAPTAHLSLLQPGRFLEPGELEGSPMLTFCPLPAAAGRAGRGSLHATFSARFEAYKRKVVQVFFAEHFRRLDRQVVLVDLLGALNAGPAALDDMRAALDQILGAFRHGRAGWLARLTGGRIDRVLFAATKADHVASNQHGNLKSLLAGFVAERARAVRFQGAEVECMALAAVKCTETVTTEHDGRQLYCVQGIPLGRDRPTVLFPGELPDHPGRIGPDDLGRFSFLSFRPPPGLGRDGRGLPNIRLDTALQYLIGDRLA
ncbi:YcjX family GTP-binding protein [Arenibaculum pallidiluteum]|uniref:YcjX family protein n=1 Tax=Arenibaculum pallidiluteum TaxID=2812559 RepID=UPI001A978B50|nr:YcjX family protein [Arenibaculum pallidiluteum]